MITTEPKIRIPRGAAKTIAANLRPGVETIVEPEYIAAVKAAAKEIGLSIKVRKFYRVGGFAFSVVIVAGV
jgi:hypothetical protein